MAAIGLNMCYGSAQKIRPKALATAMAAKAEEIVAKAMNVQNYFGALMKNSPIILNNYCIFTFAMHKLFFIGSLCEMKADALQKIEVKT